MIAESVLTSDAVARESPQFVARVNTRMVAAGVCEVLREGRFDEVLEFLGGAKELGISPPSLFDAEAVRALGVECRRFVEERRLEEFVELMENLAGNLGYFRQCRCDHIHAFDYLDLHRVTFAQLAGLTSKWKHLCLRS